ncbi:hypothetical protein [Lacinutrix salivirga]
MALNNIEKLLEKYENGETTLHEEQQLKNYFSQETVAPHLEVYKPMFTYFLVNQQEQFTKNLPLQTKNKFNYKWLSVAAVTVLMFGFYLNTSFGGDTYSEKEQYMAFNQFKTSMEMVSKNFNKGTAKVSYLGEIEKAGTQVGYLEEIENTTSIIFKTKK